MKQENHPEASILSQELVVEAASFRSGSIANFNDKEFKRFVLRNRVLHRIRDLGVSIESYIKILKESETERLYTELTKIPNASTIRRWRDRQDDREALARGTGGKGSLPNLANWHVIFILEKLAIDWNAKATSIAKIMKAFGDHYGYWLPKEATIRRFIRHIRAHGGMADLLSQFRLGKFYQEYRVKLRRVYKESNEIWETDGTSIPMQIWLPKLGNITPYLLLTIDCYSGLPIGWTLLKKTATSADNIAHLCKCILMKGVGPRFGGTPKVLQSDNAFIYSTAKDFHLAAAKLGIRLQKSPPYCPSANGCIERLNQTLKKEFCSRFTSYLQNRKRKANTFKWGGTWESLCQELDNFMIEYAHTHVRRGHHDSVLQDWLDGIANPETLEPNEEFVRASCLAEYECKMGGEGVNVRGLQFVSERLRKKNGAPVVVYANPDGEPKTVEALVGGVFIPLVRNCAADASLVRRLKDASALQSEGMIDLCQDLRERAEEAAEIFVPGTANGLKARAAQKTPGCRPAKDIKVPDEIIIPKFRTR